MEYLIEDLGKKNIAYKSLVVKNPSILGTLSNNLGLKILKELAGKPSCAMDLARKLKEHEQKIYYHIRNLEKNGLIKLVGTEERTGGTAKIYGVDYQAVSLKLIEEGQEIPNIDLEENELLKPFVENGKLNCKIVVGSPYPHGKFNASARDDHYAIDIAFFIGNFVKKLAESPFHILDTEIRESDLKKNLILIGGAKVNVITYKLNKYLPIYFNEKNEWDITSKITKKVYTYDYDCTIIKMKNPFNKENEILVFGGKRSIGTGSGILAFTKYFNKLMSEIGDKKNVAKVVTGLDKNGDGRIDDIEFLE